MSGCKIHTRDGEREPGQEDGIGEKRRRYPGQTTYHLRQTRHAPTGT